MARVRCFHLDEVFAIQPALRCGLCASTNLDPRLRLTFVIFRISCLKLLVITFLNDIPSKSCNLGFQVSSQPHRDEPRRVVLFPKSGNTWCHKAICYIFSRFCECIPYHGASFQISALCQGRRCGLSVGLQPPNPSEASPHHNLQPYYIYFLHISI